ncbi:MAG: bifunctional phosphopantothenoylcysteine decarboxylase/phosphopantothenate--cysteine ligase CoaBC [bacterium]|nr:bifunctional phosphopantothenoylcysteine decarboxylase/phosphopantothenate--cysteine ligase CoaBC [bacterium]
MKKRIFRQLPGSVSGGQDTLQVQGSVNGQERTRLMEETQSRLFGRKILLGITGGIGAYKAAELTRALQREGAQVSVVMTGNATRFITPLTMETLSRNPVGLDMFSLTDERTIGHIERARWAELFLVAPATANFIGKAANGIADDLLTTILLVMTCPVVVAPAMNSRMWGHPAVRENLAKLRERGVRIVPPEEGELACGEEGPGRLADPSLIIEEVRNCLSERDLEGIRVLVSAGPTREPIDPVRFISNRSTGRMGYALARSAAERGALVALVSGPVELERPGKVAVREVTTAKQMNDAVQESLPDADWLIMAAAVADYTPSRTLDQKIRKEGREEMSIELVRNPDILREAAQLKGSRLYVGFAAETEEVVASAREKLAAKGLDMIVANDVSGKETGFASDHNMGTIIDNAGGTVKIPKMTKREMANRILDHALVLWKSRKLEEKPERAFTTEDTEKAK